MCDGIAFMRNVMCVLTWMCIRVICVHIWMRHVWMCHVWMCHVWMRLMYECVIHVIWVICVLTWMSIHVTRDMTHSYVTWLIRTWRLDDSSRHIWKYHVFYIRYMCIDIHEWHDSFIRDVTSWWLFHKRHAHPQVTCTGKGARRDSVQRCAASEQIFDPKYLLSRTERVVLDMWQTQAKALDAIARQNAQIVHESSRHNILCHELNESLLTRDIHRRRRSTR